MEPDEIDIEPEPEKIKCLYCKVEIAAKDSVGCVCYWGHEEFRYCSGKCRDKDHDEHEGEGDDLRKL